MSERNHTALPATDTWLEQLLADDGREHRAGYLADDGFTARVAAALPPPMALPAWPPGPMVPLECRFGLVPGKGCIVSGTGLPRQRPELPVRER